MHALPGRTNGPKLTAFLSYHSGDRELVRPLKAALASAGVEVLDYQDDERVGVDIPGWIEQNVAEADCMIVVVSDAGLANRLWLEREVGLAVRLLGERGNMAPAIAPVRLGCWGSEPVVTFQPRNFRTDAPEGPPVVWRTINCLMPDQDGVGPTVERFLKSFEPRTTFVTRPEAHDQHELFAAAMRLYRELLPDERERDFEDDIVRWLSDSWHDDCADDRCRWLNALAVHHIGGKVIGIFWCGVDRRTSIGFVSFWGVLATHRSKGRSVAFARDILGRLRAMHPPLRAMLFAAERVEWAVLDRFLDDAAAARRRRGGGRRRPAERYDGIDEPIDGGPSALEEMFNEASERRLKAVNKELRRFRRFELYVSGGVYTKSLERAGIALRAFARRPTGAAPERADPMADFVQPPIRPPATAANDCQLWLFALTFDGQDLAAAEAVDWVYDEFLKGSLGAGPTEMPGWNEYMVGFKARHRDRFAAGVELRRIRLLDWFAPYRLLMAEAKKFSVRQQVLGRAGGRWDIQI